MKKIFNLLFILLSFSGGIVLGQAGIDHLLYPNGIKDNPIIHMNKESYGDSLVNPKSLSGLNRVYSFISIPKYQLYPAADSNNKHIGIVICPGGGQVNNWLDKEGTDIALWFSKMGISCLVLKYRTNAKDNNGKFLIPPDIYQSAAVLDAKTAILTLKSLSDKWKIDKGKIGIIGFSAGGWLSAKLVYESTEGIFDWNPSFVGLIYYGDFGNNANDVENLKNKDKLPPFFMAVARDDKRLPINILIPYLSTIVLEVNKSELHIYSKGDHGFGLAYDAGNSVELWKYSFVRWLLDIYTLRK